MRLHDRIQSLRQQLGGKLDERHYRYFELDDMSKTEAIVHYKALGGSHEWTLKDSKHDIILSILELEIPIDPLLSQIGLLEGNK